jgi:hypothetical protein
VEVGPSEASSYLAGCTNCSSSRGRDFVRREIAPWDMYWKDGGCGLQSGFGSNFVFLVPSPKKWAGEYCLMMGCFRGESCRMKVVFYRNGVLEKVPAAREPDGSLESCAPGYVCNAPCPLGTASTQANATHASYCEPCAAGFYSGAEMGATSCTACAAGTYSSRVGAILPSSCQPCPAGTYCPAGSVAYITCKEGTYADTPGSRVCSRCTHGHFSTEGSSDCYPCPPGTFATGSQGGCEPCAPGSYAPWEAMSSCLPCEENEVTPVFGATQCKPCGSSVSPNVTTGASISP